MTDQHTPGPWTIREEHFRGRTWRGVYGFQGAQVIDTDGFTLIRNGEQEEHYGVRISEANARLIAAAPAMLAALRALSGWLHLQHSIGGLTDQGEAHRRAVVAAIAQATQVERSK